MKSGEQKEHGEISLRHKYTAYLDVQASHLGA